MLEDNGIFKIDAGVSHGELDEIHKNIVKNIKDINTIEVSDNDELKSSALFSLLMCVKNSNPKIKIPLIEEQNSFLNGLGSFSITK